MSAKYVIIQRVVKRIILNIIQPLNIQNYVMVVMIACKIQKILTKYVSNIHVYVGIYINMIAVIIDIKRIAITNTRSQTKIAHKYPYTLMTQCK
jgi:hypothetical protein